MRLETLYERELNFINRLEDWGKFEYIEGYTNIKSNVKVRHKKCGCECYMNAYKVAYSDIDMCNKCGRQVRAFDKYKEKLEAINPDIKVVFRKRDKHNKCKYYVECRECGDILLVSLDVLKRGNFKCCFDGVGAYERACNAKSKELFNKVKEEQIDCNREELLDYIYGEINEDPYFINKGLINEEKMCELLGDYIEERLKKNRLGVCSCCGEYKAGVVGWGRGDINYNSRICTECAKTPKKCTICGVEKRINSYSVEDKKYTDVCQLCATKLKNDK